MVKIDLSERAKIRVGIIFGGPPTELVSRLIDLALQRGRRRAAIGRSFFQQ
jgi:hypothetical protein